MLSLPNKFVRPSNKLSICVPYIKMHLFMAIYYENFSLKGYDSANVLFDCFHR